MEIKIDSKKLASVLDLFTSDGMDQDLIPDLKYLHDLVRQAHAKLAVVRIDETKNWSLTGPKPETIWGVYLVDMNEHTYCCSILPSLYLYFLYNSYTGEVNDEIEEHFAEDENKYVDVQAFPAADTYTPKPTTPEELEESYETFIEANIEHYRCNHCL